MEGKLQEGKKFYLLTYLLIHPYCADESQINDRQMTDMLNKKSQV